MFTSFGKSMQEHSENAVKKIMKGNFMKREIQVALLDQETTNRFNQTIDELEASGEEDNELDVVFNATKGDIKTAIPILQKVHGSNVHMSGHAKGIISSGGTLLLVGCKPGRRTVEMSAMLGLNDEELEKLGRFRNVKNPNSGIMIHMLSELTGKKKAMKDIVTMMNVISPFDAVRYGLVDIVEGFKTKYEDEVKPKNKKKGDEAEAKTEASAQTA